MTTRDLSKLYYRYAWQGVCMLSAVSLTVFSAGYCAMRDHSHGNPQMSRQEFAQHEKKDMDTFYFLLMPTFLLALGGNYRSSQVQNIRREASRRTDYQESDFKFS